MTRNFFKYLLLFTISILPGIAFAQSSGTIIHGRVSDNMGPLVMANVLEIDAANRTVTQDVTDVNGDFSMRIKDSKNRLQFTYMGHIKQIIPIKGAGPYNIKMEDKNELGVVEVVKKKTFQSSGLAVPEREISIAAQTIDAKEFEGLGITSIDEALQGRISGLDIISNSGDLGAGTSMRLRGVSSINGNTQPLIVVDGNVWETDLNNFDFNSANEEKFAQLLNVNPEDVASITVLKDAAATAPWGSQGANGVIDIKLKRGSKGATKVTYSYRMTATHLPKGMNMLNGDDYTMLMKEEYFNPKLSDDASNIEEFNYDPSFSEYQEYKQNTDWVKAVSKNGFLQNHYVSLSGGGDKATFRISGGYDNQTGTIIGQKLDRFTTRVALDYYVSDRIKIVTNFDLTYTDNKQNYSDLLGIAYQKMPNLSIYDLDANGVSTGEYYNMLSSSNGVFASNQLTLANPVALAYEAKNENYTYNITPEFQLQYNLLGIEAEQTKLTYEGKIVFSIYNAYTDKFFPSSLVTTGWSATTSNLASSDASKSLGITTTHALNFTPHFENKDHSFLAMAQFQMTSGTSNSQSDAVYGLPSGSISSAASQGIISGFSTSVGEWRSAYFTFSAHYMYKGKYGADFTIRRDGSTKFGPSERWGNFPSLSFRWNVSDEPFIKQFGDKISMLSLRPGWGISGNAPGSEALYFSKYSAGDSYNSSSSIYQSNIRLNKLKWEQKETYNLGSDLGFFNNLITADVNIYSQLTSDLLMNGYSIPTSSGFSSLSVLNTGSMKNNGWEFNIFGNEVIKSGKFKMDVNVSFANNKNTMTSMDPTILASLNSDFDRSNGSYLTRVQLNNAFGSIYGFRYKGVYQYSKYSDAEVKGVSGPNAPVVKSANGQVILDENQRTKPMYFCYGTSAAYEFKGGDAMYEDINHDGNINEQDIVYLGSSLPKITGGFGLKFSYGRLSLNNQFNFRYGNKIINKARMNAENMYSNNNQSKAVNWRWRVEGDNTDIPRALYNYGYNWLGSDRFVEDGSFLRLNYSQISYSVDPKQLKLIGLEQLSLYFTANNLFCLTKYSGADPEVGYGSYGVTTDNAQTPRARSFTAGITITF